MQLTRLRQWREYRGLRQEDLAECTGVSRAGISRYEGGEASARPSTARKLAGALGVDVEDLSSPPARSESSPLARNPEILNWLASLSPGELRMLTVGLFSEWTSESDDTLATLEEARRIADGLGVEPGEIREHLESVSPHAVKKLRRAQAEQERAMDELLADTNRAAS